METLLVSHFQPGSGPSGPLSCTGRAKDLLFISAASWVPFSWVCSWPFTQVTCTCCILMIMAPLPTLPPKREPQQCVPCAPSLSFHPSQGLQS